MYGLVLGRFPTQGAFFYWRCGLDVDRELSPPLGHSPESVLDGGKAERRPGAAVRTADASVRVVPSGGGDAQGMNERQNECERQT